MTTGEVSKSAAEMATYSVIGSRPIRHDGADKVTGRAIFGADVRLPDMLQARVLRSPLAHARIKSIDTSQAEALPGVLAVVTAKDIWDLDLTGGLQPSLGEEARVKKAQSEARVAAFERVPAISPSLKYFRDRFLASDKVLYCGHPVAAVAAVDQFIAEEALDLIKVEYEVLPSVMDVLKAMEDNSPLLHEEMETSSLGRPTGKRSNVAQHIRFLKGNPDEGFAEADVVVEREFQTANVHQGYLEAHVATASCSPDGQITVWSTHQGHFTVRDEIARLLQHPIAKIRVIPTEVGGGFGGKLSSYVQPVAALLAYKAGRPVRLGMSRSETLEATGPTPASVIRLKIGATREGLLVAATSQIMFAAGAFPGSSVATAAMCMFGPYEIPHCQIDGYDVVVNRPQTASYRGPGATQSAFAAESLIDEICAKIGLDPLAFRLKNAAKEGTRAVYGRPFPRIGFAETIEAAMAHQHFQTPLIGPNRGRGVACGFWPNFAFQSSCNLSINSDGSVNLALGSVDLSGTRTTVAMQVAEVMGIDVNQIHPAVVDTDAVAYTGDTGGSRTTFAMGAAAVEAAWEAIRQMSVRCARIWEVPIEEVVFAGGVFACTSDSTKYLTFAEVAAKLPMTGGPISTAASLNPRAAGSAIGVHIVDVEVDPETGKVKVLRYTAVQDAGTAIHPALVEGQIQGGVVQGVGWALWEGYQYDRQGRLQNKSFLDYKMPTALDVPNIDAVIVEVPNPGHPFGVRGVGEIGIVAPPAAIANAVSQAIGARVTELPITAVQILRHKGIID